ncbi:MAG: serine protease AprX, partial [Sphingomonadales bacterium]|nr:serine protease AprX [Sphingomonadales bacterium]
MIRSFAAESAAAARTEFDVSGDNIVWAILSAGIDGSHPHFRTHANLELPAGLRHVDFTSPDLSPEISEREALTDLQGVGTHAAALVAGDPKSPVLATAAHKCKIVSLKIVADDGKRGGEREVVLALEHLAEVNREQLRIHGVLVPLSIPMDVRNYPAGASPVCRALEQLVRLGMVAVAAAGNRGFDDERKVAIPYSITDPGNAELALTVGSTGRDPQLHGVSWFSCRGPTLDGRVKPDILAQGERVSSALPMDEVDQRDGSSTAAAIVSAGIAMLLSAFPRLIGHPLEVKRLLMENALDLRADRYGQGAGAFDLVATLRAARKADSATIAEQPAPAPAPIEKAGGTQSRLEGEVEPVSLAGPARRYKVAVSFAGTDREFVTGVVYRLRGKGMRREHIFFDDFVKAALARPNLDAFLEKVYA